MTDGIIIVCHNYQEREGLKAPKCGSVRQVPIPASVQSALDTVRALSDNPAPEEYVMLGPLPSGKPLSTKFFQRALAGELAGITDLEIQALAGHKSGVMMERYSHAGQVLDFASARESFQNGLRRGLFRGRKIHCYKDLIEQPFNLAQRNTLFIFFW